MNKIADDIRLHYMKNHEEFQRKKRMEFEDLYNPLKIYAFLRKGFNIPRERAQELANWYEYMFYKTILKETDILPPIN